MASVVVLHQENSLKWWEALQPPIYLISILPAISVLTLCEPTIDSLGTVFLAVAGVVLLQHGINVLNDVTDWIRNADVEKNDSWIRFHQESISQARWHGYLSWFLGAFVGLLALYVADKIWLASIAGPLVVLGFCYNLSKKPISYTRHSEWVTALCYGPGVFGCLYLLVAPNVSWSFVMGSMGYGALSLSVLLAHQPSQVLTDSLAGKHSFAVRYGSEKTVRISKQFYRVGLLSLAISLWFGDVNLVTKFAHTLMSIIFIQELNSQRLTTRWILLSAWAAVSIPLVLEAVRRSG